MSQDLFTTVIAVDANYVAQLAYSVLTWQLYRKQIFENPLLVIVDRQNHFDIIGKLPPAITGHKKLQIHVWPDEAHADAPFVNQRERMLSAFVHAPPRLVETPWWLKVDCDAIALGNPDAWFDPAWFAGDKIIVAPKWGYSKPGHQPGDLDAWANEHFILSQYPPLNIPYNGEKRLGHERICSWVSFYNARWTRWASMLCDYPRIPVPSQDGYHWFIAARTKDTGRVLKVNMKRLGWDNISKLENLKEKVTQLVTTRETR